MPLRIIRGSEQAPLTPLMQKAVAVIGYGNQGAAHAQNLRDSGVRVIVGASPSSRGAAKSREHGFETLTIAEAATQADLLILALPDEAQPQVYQSEISPHLKAGSILGFLHGFNIRYGFIQPRPDIGVVMIAPKGPGQTLRDRFVQGQGIPCLYAMHQDSPAKDAEGTALAWANGIGCARAGIIFTTFANETDTDLFGEQAVLCGGMTQLILAAFETLVNAGYPPELAYLECCHEVKQIADLVYARGMSGMMQAISNTAEFGAYQAGPMVIDDHVRQRMREVLQRVQDGSFARDLQHDHAASFSWFEQQRARLREHEIESAGQTIRDLMPWLSQ
jgi:ketol-acid reductoisomerase